MKYSSHVISLILLSIGILAFPGIKTEKAEAIGCDTYYRVSGNISGCSDISTDYARNLWIEKYSACLEQQLLTAIIDYNRKLPNYYAQWQKNKGLEPDMEFEDISSKYLDSSFLNLSERRSRIYKGLSDFCE